MHVEGRGLTGQRGVVIVGRVRHLDLPALARRQAGHARLEVLEHAAATEQHRDVVALAALERRAVDLAREIHGDAVAVAAGALHRIEARALLAQVLHHRVDVGVGDRRRRALHGDAVDALELDLREDLERGAVAQVLVRVDAEGLDARAGSRIQLLLRDRLGEARLHQVGQHFLAHLRAELLLHDLERHLARAEALQLRRAADALQALVDRLLDALPRNADFDAALEGARRLDRNLHAGRSSQGTGTPGGRPEKPRILPRIRPRRGTSREGGAKGGTRTLTGVTRWNLNPVRLPVPPLSRTPARGPATGRIL